MTIHTCRSCGAKGLQTVLPLGLQPLANNYLPPEALDQEESKYTLTLAVCPHCGLAQILESVPPEEMFSDYLYFSSFSDTMVQHGKDVAEELIPARGLGPESLVVELASNDGYLLQWFVKQGIPVLGIEPAANVAKVAEEKGVTSLVEFFGADLAERLRGEGKQADLILANNVLAHVPDLNGVVKGISRLLKPQGQAVIEVPYVRHLIERCEFDTIYHEHFSYFSLTALNSLFARHGMEIVRCDEIPLHGGSLRFFAMLKGAQPVGEDVTRRLAEELELGMDGPGFYEAIGEKVAALKADLVPLLETIKAEGKRVVGYGAAAKATVLLNYFQIGTDLLEFVVDRSTYKQGRYIPGVRVPIYAPERLMEEKPEYCLLHVWNIAEEIFRQQAAYRESGGKFIVPVPEVRVLED